MRILLDTHILLWTIQGSPLLPERARLLIEDESNEIHYSTLAMLEVAIKHAKHPDLIPIHPRDLMEYCAESGFYDTPLEERHTFLLDSLSRPDNAPKHNDPIDRAMICQAISEGMLFLTHDALLLFYDEPCILFV
ncbi:MAG: type II toxin-antitoxin system VapC family toxin [Eggerthellaceae bacterium]|nr:type II toxin-antitoxin system VapC family toxin [Eggerthellaceae bacterium]